MHLSDPRDLFCAEYLFPGANGKTWEMTIFAVAVYGSWTTMLQ